MNRFQKKCFIISTGLHLLLAGMVLAGSAFLSSRGKPDDAPILDFVSPDMIPIDGDASGGGGPMMSPRSVQPPQPVEPPVAPPPVQPPIVQTPPPPQPQPQPKPEVAKAPTPEPPKIIKPSPEAIEVPKDTKRKIVVSTELVTSNQKTAQAAKEAQLAADKAAAKKAADAQRKLAAAIGNTRQQLRSGMSSGTDIKFNRGFGGTGPAYASWLSIIKTIYYNDWKQRLTDGLTDDSAVAEATVTIAKDGTVISADITQSSGNSAVDRSIQTTLNRVKFTSRFPESSKEEQTTLILVFSVKALKQLLG